MQHLASYPASSWRPNQRDYAERVHAVATGGIVARHGLEGPCGCGKSIGYLRGLLASDVKSQVLTTTRQHLRQLEETLRTHWPEGEGVDWALLRGRNFYTCCGAKSTAKREIKNPITEIDHDPKADWTGEEDAAAAEAKSACPLGEDGCLYRKAVFAAADARIVIQCTIGGLYRRRYWGELEVGQQQGGDSEKARKRAAWILARRAVVDRKVVVLDEAHEYLKVRRDFETSKQELWLKGVMSPGIIAALQKARGKPGGYTAGYVLLEAESPLRLMLEGEFRRLLKPEAVEKMLPAGKHLDNRDEIKRRWVEKLEARLAVLVSGDVVSVQYEGFGMTETAKLVSEPLFANVGEPLADVEIFTSATIRDIAPLLKIPRANMTVYPEIFDWEGKVAVNPLPDNAGGSQRSVAVDAATLEEIYHAEGRPLTVVLYLSKTQTSAATKNLARQPGVFVQGLDRDTDLGELVEEVRRAGGAPMLVCYGGWVGTDLPGDKWLVIGAAPKTPISAVHEARQARGRIRSAWQDAEKVTLDRLQLAQGLGRALRSERDSATVIWPANGAFSELGLSPVTGRLQ